MDKIPATPQRFKNWLNKQLNLPADLEKAALESLQDRELLALNRNSVGYAAIKARCQPRIDQFNETYTAWAVMNG